MTGTPSDINIPPADLQRMLERSRVLLLAAHPDDEAIGAGASISSWRDVVVVTATQGAPADGHDARRLGFADVQSYAAARHAELLASLACAGIKPSSHRTFGLHDQQLTHSLTDMTRSVVHLIQALQPRIVLTHAYEGGHPDHDALAFAAQWATELLRCAVAPGSTQPGDVPLRVEMAGYHAADGTLTRQHFIGIPGTLILDVQPTDLQQHTKRRMMNCHFTQRSILAGFSPEVERFRVAPWYDFASAPHAGTLHYETWPSGMTGERWRELAAAAASALAAHVDPSRRSSPTGPAVLEVQP